MHTDLRYCHLASKSTFPVEVLHKQDDLTLNELTLDEQGNR